MARINHFTSWLIATLIVASLAPQALADDPDNCLLCHQYRGLGRLDAETSRVRLFFVDPTYNSQHSGPHARLACTACHERSEVDVIPHKTTTQVDCLRQCHLANPGGVERIFSHASVKETLDVSMHKFSTLATAKFSKGPLLASGQSLCLYCHDEPIFRDPVKIIPNFRALEDRLTDRCETCHTQDAPEPIEYYLHHVASRLQPARSALELAQVCAVCHSDPEIQKTHKLKDAVASFVRSFHGKAAMLGEDRTANCLSCHVAPGKTAHSILAPSDPDSSVNPAHVADSCRTTLCHPGADKKLALAAVHLDLPTSRGSIDFALAALFVILTIFTFGPSAMLVLLDLLQIVVGREHHHDAQLEGLTKKLLADPKGKKGLTRFSVGYRVQHWVLSILFVLLVLTGFPMKFADRGWATALVNFFGGLQAARVVHHWAGIALVVGFVSHMLQVYFGFRRRSRQLALTGDPNPAKAAFTSLPMWISPADVVKTFQLFAYLLFLRKERPSFGRFSPAEKFEYLGVFWGTMLLGLTGMILWGEQISSHFLSGRVLNLATIAHTYEAFLALIHVGILHIYNVILAPKVFPLSRATITGYTPPEKLMEEHSDLIHEVAEKMGFAEGAGGSHGA